MNSNGQEYINHVRDKNLDEAWERAKNCERPNEFKEAVADLDLNEAEIDYVWDEYVSWSRNKV